MLGWKKAVKSSKMLKFRFTIWNENMWGSSILL